MTNCWRTKFKTSYREHIMVGQCPLFVSMDNQSYLPSRKLSGCIITSSVLPSENCTKLWNFTIEPSWWSHSITVKTDYQSVWNLSKVQRSSTTLSSLPTAIQCCFQPWSRTRSNVDWKEGSATRFWHRDRIQYRDVSVLSGSSVIALKTWKQASLPSRHDFRPWSSWCCETQSR